MIIKLDLPMPKESDAVNSYWLRQMFTEFPTDSWQVNVLASTFVSLAQNAALEYRQACQYAKTVYVDRGTGIQLGALHMMARRFENVISNMHRAMAAFKQLRGHEQAPREFAKYLKANRPAFSSEKVDGKDGPAKRVREMRNAIHHTDEQVGKGQIQPGEPVHIALAGMTYPAPDNVQPNQTLKIYDRLALGPHEIRLEDLCDWLTEMGQQAQYIAAYNATAPVEQPPLPAATHVFIGEFIR